MNKETEKAAIQASISEELAIRDWRKKIPSWTATDMKRNL